MKLKFEQMRALAIANDMVGVETVASDLNDTSLIAAIKQKRIKFGSETSAAYHIFKHDNIQNIGDYVNLANETIRAESGQATVIITQDGDTRLVNFKCDTGTCTVLERDGRVLLCTFQPLNHKSKWIQFLKLSNAKMHCRMEVVSANQENMEYLVLNVT